VFGTVRPCGAFLRSATYDGAGGRVLTRRLAFTALAAFSVTACGGSASSPDNIKLRTYFSESTAEGPWPAHSVACVEQNLNTADKVYAHVTPPYPIEIGAGRCADQTTGAIASNASGEVTAVAGPGWIRVRFTNTSELDTRYDLTLRYPVLY